MRAHSVLFQLCARLHGMLGCLNPCNVNGLTWALIRSGENDCHIHETVTNANSCLSHACELMKECFEPVIDPHYKRDLVDDVIFNSV